MSDHPDRHSDPDGSLGHTTRPAPLTTHYATGRHYHWLYGDLNAWRQGKIGLPMLARSV